jgi:anti-sigma regulatory factor (Ser/Thr protein kinase)
VPTFTKRITARREEVFAALEELQEFLGGCALGLRLRNAVEVAAEELVSNAWKYAFPDGEPGEVTLLVDAAGERARLEVSDTGFPFDPTLVPPPPPPTLDVPPGGRGIHLVRGLSSSFAYRREGSRNVVTVGFRAS